LKQAANRSLLHTGFFLGIFFDYEDRGDIFFRNVGCVSEEYTAIHPGRQNSATVIFVMETKLVLCETEAVYKYFVSI
jgi:hypothetical protein